MRFKNLKLLVLASASLALFGLSACASGSDEAEAADSPMVEEDSSSVEMVEIEEADQPEEMPENGNAQPVEVVEVETVSEEEASAEMRLVNSFVERAKASYKAGNFKQAMTEVDFALDLDANNRAAKQVRNELISVLAQDGGVIRDNGDVGDNLRSEAEFDIQRNMYDARRALESEQFAISIAKAERAIELIRWSQARGDTATLLAEARELIDIARERREEQRVGEEVRIRENQRRAQELIAQSKLQSYRNEIRNLYSEAKSFFDNRDYKDAVKKLNQILRKDPFNAEVLELRSISIRLERGARVEAAERNFSSAWNTAIALLDDANAFPNEHLRWPSYELWQRVEDRWRRLRARQVQDVSKEDATIFAALESSSVKFTFGSGDETVTVGQVISEFRSSLSNVNFHIKGDAGDLELERQDLGDMRLGAALELLGSLTGNEMRWRVENGTIYITGSDETASSVSRIYDIADILITLKDFKGVEPRLATDDAGENRFGDELEDEEREGIEGDALVELLTEVLAEDVEKIQESSDGEREIFEVRASQLAVYAPRNVIQKVDTLLKDLRSSQGLVVNIEARFITIRDDFLEDIGIDFRGVGGSPSGTNPQPVSAVLDDISFGTSSVPVGAGTSNQAGFFFQDISAGTAVDEDIRGRVENLFDQSVGGRRGGTGLTNSGGASFQLSFVDNPEITAILRAVQKRERAVLLTAPAISVHNTQRGNVSILNELKYIRDFNVNVSASAAVADPIVDVIRDGIVLDVRPTVSADRRYVTLELRPTLATLVRPIATIATSLGQGPPVSIQTPELQLQRLRTTITVPDGGSFLIGGLRRVLETDLESGVPVLSDIPVIGWLFTRKAKTTERQDIIIIVSVMIVDLEEQAIDIGFIE